eukprot:1891159-Pyramimonas_sp.AAC.1
MVSTAAPAAPEEGALAALPLPAPPLAADDPLRPLALPAAKAAAKAKAAAAAPAPSELALERRKRFTYRALALIKALAAMHMSHVTRSDDLS